MKVAFLNIWALGFAIEQSFIDYVLDSGYDFAAYRYYSDGGLSSCTTFVQRKISGPISFDDRLFALFAEKKYQEEDYIYFSKRARDIDYLDNLRAFFKSIGAEIKEIDLTEAKNIADVDRLLQQ
jgi:hypothetical protein